MNLILFLNLNLFQVIYISPCAASETPAAGDKNLIGSLIKNQELQNKEAIRKLARGSSKYFAIFVVDTGFQVRN